MKPFFLLGAALAVTLFAVPVTASDLSSFTIEQYQFRGAPTPSGISSTDVGALIVDNTSTPGFVNMWSADGTQWLVRNLPVFGVSSSGPDANLSSVFNLGALAGSGSLRIDFSSSGPLTDASGLNAGFALSNSFLHTASPVVTPYGIGGVDNTAANPAGGRLQPSFLGISFNLGGRTAIGNTADSAYQFGHPNVEAALNQCAPAAVANSLQWLDDQYGIDVPDPNDAGLKGDDTLVGKLDTAMERRAPTRTDGDGVWPLDGKLSYLDDNNLGWLSVKYQAGTGVDGSGTSAFNGGAALDGTTDYTANNLTAAGKSPAGGGVTFDWILKELQHGEDVEMDISFQCGVDEHDEPQYCRHYVEVTGAGYILGIPYITHLSDHAQTDEDPNDTEGTDQLDFDFVKLNNKGVITSLPGWENATIDQAISESVPEPGMLLLISSGILALLWWRRRHTN